MNKTQLEARMAKAEDQIAALQKRLIPTLQFPAFPTSQSAETALSRAALEWEKMKDPAGAVLTGMDAYVHALRFPKQK